MNWPDMGLGALVGGIAGGVGGFAASAVLLTLKCWRNGRLAARGLPPLRDVVRVRLEMPGAAVGLIAGAVALALTHRWPAAAWAGIAAPAALLGVGSVAPLLRGLRAGR